MKAPEAAGPQPSLNLVRFLPIAGVFLTAVTGAAWGVLFATSRSQALAVLAGLATLVYAGKEAGIPVGMAAGANAAVMGVFVLLTDTAATCFIYPPLHHAIRTLLPKQNWIGAYLRHVHERATTSRALVARYGTWGLFLFMLVPFAINGPLFGAILGRVMGLRARQIVPTLIAAIAVTTLAWTAIYGFSFPVVEAINPTLPKLITGAILVGVVGHGIWSMVQIRRHAPAPVPPEREEVPGPARNT